MGEYPEIRGFEFLGVLRRGGSATIYEAVDLASGRHVAVKVLEGVELTSSQQLAFSQEVRVMGNLDDEPHVVPVLQSGATAMGRPYVVMQLMVGGSLADRIERVGPLPVDDVLAVGIGVGLALEATHTRGIRHCDVKPANILFDHELRPMLSDFGVANVDAGDDSLTKRLGMTAMYAAPEVINDEVPTTASDIYSLGATLHAALMGRPPFSARSNVALFQKILAAETPPPLPDRVPAALRELIHSMMQRNPADRPIRAGDIAAGLQRIAGGANTLVDHPTSGRERSGAQSVFDSISLDAPLVPSADNWPSATTPAAVATVQEAAPAVASAQRSAGRSTRGRALLLLVAPLIIVGGIVGVSAVTGSPETSPVVNPSAVQVDGPRSSAAGDVQDAAEQAGKVAGGDGDEPPADELAMVDDEADSSVFPADSASSTPTPEPSATTDSSAGSVSFESEPSEEQPTASALIEDLPPATVTTEPRLDDEPTPVPSATPTTPTTMPQPTTTRVPAETPSATPLPSPTPTAQTQSASTASPSPTTTPPPTATAVPTATPTLAPTATPTPAPTATPTGVPQPTNLRSLRQGIDGSGRLFISLEWSTAGDIPKVEIERDGVIIGEDNNLSRRDTPNPSLVPGQQVAYRVRAVGVNGAFSDWSERLDVIVQMPDPSEVIVPRDLRVTAQGFESASGHPFIGLGWSAPDWMSFVEIDRDGVLFTDDNRSHRDVPEPALVQGQTVTYRIRAVHHSGQKSPWSPDLVVIVSSS